MKISNWWNNNMNENLLPTFKGWVGDFNSESKKIIREYIISKEYSSILDVGCGLCDTYYGYKNDNYYIDYTGLDSCSFFINEARKNNINIIESDMNNINIPDSNYDVVYGRHILEHLPTFKNALNEMIRICKYETIIIFFIKPSDNEEIKYDTVIDLYHNIYSKKDIENYISNYYYEWKDINEKEISLHIKKMEKK